jgi:hypothetical protein
MTHLRRLFLVLVLQMAGLFSPASAQTEDEILRGFLGVVSIIAAMEAQSRAEADGGQPLAYAASAYAPARSIRPAMRPWTPSGRGLPLGAPEPRDPSDYNLPSSCLQHLPLDDRGRGIFLLPVSCLASRQIATQSLPGACILRFDLVDSGRPVFSVPCLLDRGYVLGH